MRENTPAKKQQQQRIAKDNNDLKCDPSTKGSFHVQVVRSSTEGITRLLYLDTGFPVTLKRRNTQNKNAYV